MEHILHLHCEVTVDRSRTEPVVLAIQDTSVLYHTGLEATKGLDKFDGVGILAHAGLEVTPEGRPQGLFTMDATLSEDPWEVGGHWILGQPVPNHASQFRNRLAGNRRGRGPPCRSPFLRLLVPIATPAAVLTHFAPDRPPVPVQLPRNGKIRKSACPQRVNLVSFFIGQVVAIEHGSLQKSYLRLSPPSGRLAISCPEITGTRRLWCCNSEWNGAHRKIQTVDLGQARRVKPAPSGKQRHRTRHGRKSGSCWSQGPQDEQGHGPPCAENRFTAPCRLRRRNDEAGCQGLHGRSESLQRS